ncbi:Pentatricopeptide repeat-containing protein [Acorus calamus]|uniref:Pentatricopeptide repeat-containing protein n=1 Tax=Acorus calamus TaxID=4465 RepID=A0AAV9CYV9_ACOCL|nr:Pentatricopeptide repeat-containing protein [Acorus calamus]
MLGRDPSLPDRHTHPLLIRACAQRGSAREGAEAHCHAFKFGFLSDVFVVNTLITMYCVCGSLELARKVFDESPVLDMVSWNSMLTGCVRAGRVEDAVAVFDGMPERDVVAWNSMISAFARGGFVSEARRVFEETPCRDIVSWGAMIGCYEQNGMFGEAVALFSRMRGECALVDEVVLVSVLSACARSGAIAEARTVHALIVKTGIGSYINVVNVLICAYSNCGDVVGARGLFDACESRDSITWNSMISGCLRCGLVDDARALYESMPEKDVVSTTAMITGYVRGGRFSEGLELFRAAMRAGGIMPDEAVLASALSACARSCAVDRGKQIHAHATRNRATEGVMLRTALIDMYMKCGCVRDAMAIFQGMERRPAPAWNAVVMGLAVNGSAREALEAFDEMKRSGVAPNEITFVGVLCACRHMGWVDEGRRWFDSMVREHGIEPNGTHYGCLVDLLGRAGLVEEAEELVERMPIEPSEAAWGALLGACGKHVDCEAAERAGRRGLAAEPRNDGIGVMLSNAYASSGRWDEVVEVREVMRRRGVVKTPGFSSGI